MTTTKLRSLFGSRIERQPVTSRMALRFAKMHGGSPEIWMRMQTDHDLDFHRREMEEELAANPTLAAA